MSGRLDEFMRLPAMALAVALALAVPAAGEPATGLDRPFPAMQGEAPTPERVALGQLLFFDPVLSRDGELSCAHCHRPDRALTDGRARGRGRGGVELARNVPSLYNAGHRARLFWDGRVRDLESQALEPLLSPLEMAADPQELVARLRAIPEYRARFASAFPERAPEDAITLESAARALAAFERTLVSRSSRYDRFAAGEKGALSASERRGLTLLRSLHTRCFECHPPPTFSVPHPTAIGVPSADDGVGAATGRAGQRGQFQVPSLRNAALTAPYMHDGSLATLEDVVRFYARGGGRAHGVDPARIDDQIRPFDLREQEIADLVAFLRALSDESARPSVPDAVPSGLPVLAPATVETANPDTRKDPS